MAKTIIRIHANADFSTNNVGSISLEPAVPLPSGVLGAFRTRLSLAASQSPVGDWAGSLINEGVGPHFDSVSAEADHTSPDQGGLAISGGYIPAGDCTLATVVWVPSGIVAQSGLIFGAIDPNSTGERFALVWNSSGNIVSVNGRSGTGGQSVSLTPSTRGRWEFVTATRTSGTNRIRIPRTAAIGAVGATELGQSTRAIRIGWYSLNYSNNSSKTAWCAAWNRVLSDAEIDALYASAKASLAFSGIDI